MFSDVSNLVNTKYQTQYFHLQRLRDWVGKQAEREKERETRRQERLERRKAMPNHKFDDPKYEEQKSQVAEQLEDALQTGSLGLINVQ